jgi:putative transposase
LAQLRAFRHYEVANAKLLLKPDGYYIAITVFVDRAAAQPAQTNGKSLGIDFGCSTSFTTSEGERISVRVEETERLRRLQRKLAKQQRRSNNRRKTQRGIKREYQKLDNRKFDATNQLVTKLRRYEHIVIQDEALAEWQATGHGRAVQHSILGRVKARLQNLPNVTVISRYLPTSKFCPHCGHTHEVLTLRDRVFRCPTCGRTEDRDAHAAKNMLHFFESQQVPREPRDVKPVEIRPSRCDAVSATAPKAESVKQEADCP